MQNTGTDIVVFGIPIPLLIAAALTGAGVTFFGVLLQNVFETWRHKQRLQQEERLKTNEREINARREVYLKAAEELAKNFRYLSTFADLNMSVKEHSALIEKFGESTSKLNMVASQQTVTKLIAANEYFICGSLDLNAQRLPLLAARQRLDGLTGQINAEAARHDEILKNVQQGLTRTEDLPNVIKMLDAIRGHIEKMRKDEREMLDDIIPRTALLIKNAQEVSFEYGNRLIDVNLSIRKELGLPLDEDSYRTLVRQSLLRNRTAIEKFTNSLYPAGFEKV